MYHRNTSRPLYTGLKEYVQGMRDNKKNNALHKHNLLHHESRMSEYSFFDNPLMSEIDEGVRINNSPKRRQTLMNSKAEFRQGVVICVEMVRGLNNIPVDATQITVGHMRRMSVQGSTPNTCITTEVGKSPDKPNRPKEQLMRAILAESTFSFRR